MTTTGTILDDETPILAVDDDYTSTPVNGITGGVVLNILDYDLLDGQPVVPGEVTITSTPTGPLTVNPDGTVTIDPLTPAGTYTITYTICEVLNPDNCDDALVTVLVIAAPIVANDDNYGEVNGYTGQTLSNVLDNDLLDGLPVVPGEVTITSTPTEYLTVNADGTVDVIAGTPVGTHTITYTICEVLNPDNCSTAIVTVVTREFPDVTPNITAAPNIMNGKTDFRIEIRVTELNGVNTTGLITVIVPKDSRWKMKGSYDPSLTIVDGLAVRNMDWSLTEDDNLFIFTTNQVINARSFSNLAFIVEWDAGHTKGIYTITAQIIAGSGGEYRVNNNVDSEKLDYFSK